MLSASPPGSPGNMEEDCIKNHPIPRVPIQDQAQGRRGRPKTNFTPPPSPCIEAEMLEWGRIACLMPRGVHKRKRDETETKEERRARKERERLEQLQLEAQRMKKLRKKEKRKREKEQGQKVDHWNVPSPKSSQAPPIQTSHAGQSTNYPMSFPTNQSYQTNQYSSHGMNYPSQMSFPTNQIYPPSQNFFPSQPFSQSSQSLNGQQIILPDVPQIQFAPPGQVPNVLPLPSEQGVPGQMAAIFRHLDAVTSILQQHRRNLSQTAQQMGNHQNNLQQIHTQLTQVQRILDDRFAALDRETKALERERQHLFALASRLDQQVELAGDSVRSFAEQCDVWVKSIHKSME